MNVEKHLTPSEIGTIECVMPVVKLLSFIAWGVIGDRCLRPKTVALLTFVLNTAILMLFALPQVCLHR